MSVVNGQLADQNTFNNAFLSRTSDSDTTGKIDLINADSADVIDLQGTINDLKSADTSLDGRLDVAETNITGQEIRLDQIDLDLIDHDTRITTNANDLALRLRVDTNAQGLTGTQKTNAKTNIDLQNVENTSDANKPISTATQTALNLKADIVSPSFTGTPTAPTPTTGDDSTKIATTEFVQNEIDLLASFSGEGIDLKSTGIVTDKILVTDGANNFVYKFLWELMGLNQLHFGQLLANIDGTTYTELVASTSAEIKEMRFSDDYGASFGIYKGGSGSEVLIGISSLGGTTLNFRSAIPTATRISIKSLSGNLTAGTDGTQFNFNLLG